MTSIIQFQEDNIDPDTNIVYKYGDYESSGFQLIHKLVMYPLLLKNYLISLEKSDKLYDVINSKIENGHTAVHVAIITEKYESVQLLRHFGINLVNTSYLNSPLLHIQNYNSENQEQNDIIQLLIKYEENIKIVDVIVDQYRENYAYNHIVDHFGLSAMIKYFKDYRNLISDTLVKYMAANLSTDNIKNLTLWILHSGYRMQYLQSIVFQLSNDLSDDLSNILEEYLRVIDNENVNIDILVFLIKNSNNVNEFSKTLKIYQMGLAVLTKYQNYEETIKKLKFMAAAQTGVYESELKNQNNEENIKKLKFMAAAQTGVYESELKIQN